MTFEQQATQLALNALAMRSKFESETRSAFKQIDRAHDFSNLHASSPRAYDYKKAGTLHDLAQQNPLLHKLLRDMQR